MATRTPESISPVVVLFGPTAVGKSHLLASILDSRFELINADSMQVYRQMDVGTAKPSPAERARIPHHLIDVADPSEQFNAGRFVTEAEKLIAAIRRRSRVPVVAGGTAFYITSFLHGLPDAPPVDPTVRARLRGIERDEGRAALYGLLLQSDPRGAARIQPNDRYRVMRALEVFQSTGRSLFSYAWPRTPRADMRFLLLGLVRPREDIYRRIEARVRAMFDDGLLDEVKGLLSRGYGLNDPGMRGIGYRELLEMRYGCETVAEVRGRIVRNTRRYAKRQLTFFRAVPGVCWRSPDREDEIRARLEAFLEGSAGEGSDGQESAAGGSTAGGRAAGGST